MSNKKWFTIVELIIVITILSVIWSITFISTRWVKDSADLVKEKITLWNLSSSMNTFHLKFDKYPTNYYYEEN